MHLVLFLQVDLPVVWVTGRLINEVAVSDLAGPEDARVRFNFSQ